MGEEGIVITIIGMYIVLCRIWPRIVKLIVQQQLNPWCAQSMLKG